MNKPIGWESILPQLAVFFAVIKRRPAGLTPFNLFLHGRPGANKSEGTAALAEAIGLRYEFVDCSILDDVGELAGVTDLKANREKGEARLIEGDKLNADVLGLDEFLNTRPHVMPQFRLLLQGKLDMFAKEVPIKFKAIVASGNLTSDMTVGEAKVADSPTADRFAMIVQVPSLCKIKDEQQAAILEGRAGGDFIAAFKAAVASIDERFEQTEQEWGPYATLYVQALLKQVDGLIYEFEGRRGKLLRLFILAAIALCSAEPDRDRSHIIWLITRDCLSYHKLSEAKLDEEKLLAAHQMAMPCFVKTGNLAVERKIAYEPDLAAKVRLVLLHKDEVSAVTKTDIFGKVATSAGNKPLQLACHIVSGMPVFTDEPAELRKLIQRGAEDQMAEDFWPELVDASGREIIWEDLKPEQRAQHWARWLSGGLDARWNSLLAQAHMHLRDWGYDPVAMSGAQVAPTKQ